MGRTEFGYLTINWKDNSEPSMGREIDAKTKPLAFP
jgi:hypothetical protein